MTIPEKPWQGKVEEIVQSLGSNKETGLADFEAQKRLIKFGANTILRQTPIPYFQIFFDQFVDLLVLMLIFAALLSFVLGDIRNGLVIAIIVLVNALIGFTQEFKAEKILRALVKYLPLKTKVRRSGREIQIPSLHLVPGDLVILGAGDKVPADIRLIEAYDLKTDDQALTGEAKPQNKAVRDYENVDISLIEVDNCLFMGTMVADGEGLGVTTSTGMETEFGKIAHQTITIDKTLSPLQEKTHKMAKRIAILAVFITIGLIIYKYFLDKDLLDALIFSVAVAAALVPEGLPATISVALSLGARNLARRNTLTKNLVSVETLGSVTVICTDKTGTLTTGEMAVKAVWRDLNEEIKKEEKERLICEVMILCNDAQINDKGEFGDPMEIALLKWVGKKENIDFIRKKYPKVAEVPFNALRKYMSVSFLDGGKRFSVLKGAPEVIMTQCHLDENEKEKINAKFENLASQGFRVLALAYNEIFLGLAAIYDPPRREVVGAIKSCQESGIRVLMITGDNAMTAKSIAQIVGIVPRDQKQVALVEGFNLDKMSDIELRSALRQTAIFARILPAQKYRLVDNLIQMGEIVAVTGDGVNDAPALKRADIGIAMGKIGTDVSKEAADMVLLDDNFATIVRAISEGRVIFDNIKKFLFYIFSSNFGELLTVIIGLILGLPLPITAIQILAVDLGTDVLPSMSLIGEPPEGNVMKTKPRSKEVQLLTGESFLHLTIIGLVIGVGAVINFMITRALTGNYQSATTASLATLVIAQGFNVFLSRCPNTTVFKYPFWQNKYLILSVASSLLLIFALTYLDFFHRYILTNSFPLNIWPRIFLVGLVLLAVEEIYKFGRRKLQISAST